MKDFFDFILSDKVYMIIAAVVVLLVILLIGLIIKLVMESGKSKKINRQPINNNYKENVQNLQRQQPQNLINRKQAPMQDQFINTKLDEEDCKTESVFNKKQSTNQIIEQIPVLKPEVKQEIVNNIKANNNVYETQALIIENPRSIVGETEMLSNPKPKNLAMLIFSEGEQIKECSIVNSVTSIGRDPEVCDIVISSDGHIGRKHALIYSKNDKFYLTDLNSKNGTYINGERIQGERQINNGDTIKLAITEIKFKI